MNLRRALIGIGLILLSAAAVILYASAGSRESASVEFEPTESHLDFDADSAKRGDYQIRGRNLTVYLDQGSGQNTAEITQIEERGDRLFVTIHANFCGKTRDSRPLYTSAILETEPRTTSPKIIIDSEPC